MLQGLDGNGAMMILPIELQGSYRTRQSKRKEKGGLTIEELYVTMRAFSFLLHTLSSH